MAALDVVGDHADISAMTNVLFRHAMTAVIATLLSASPGFAQLIVPPGTGALIVPPPIAPPPPRIDVPVVPRLDELPRARGVPVVPKLDDLPSAQNTGRNRRSSGDRVTDCLHEGAAAGLGPNDRATYSRSCANR
jgi:hypothetical protein